MKVFIAGGRGRVGSLVSDLLAANGVEVVSGGLEDGIDVVSGAGLEAALRGVDAIVNVLNTNRFDAEGAIDFFETTTRNLGTAGAASGVGHHVLLSIVGVDRGDATDNGYYQGKIAQERALENGPLPHTIVRSTQFQSYIPVLADQYTSEGKVVASRALIQPVALEELVALLAEVVTSADPGEAVEIAGPDRFHLDDLFRGTLAAEGDAREIVTVDADGPLDALVPVGEYRRGVIAYPVAGIPVAD